MPAPREWPNNAAEARNQAAEGLQAIIRLSRPLLRHTDRVVVVRSGLILDQAQNALRHLERVGAPTCPDDMGGAVLGGSRDLDL